MLLHSKSITAIIFILMLLSIGCMFYESDTVFFKYKIDDNKLIEVHSIGYGATTKDFTYIKLQTKHHGLTTITRFEGNFGNGDTAHIDKVNDTIYKITFTDTTQWLKGMKRTFQFDIKDTWP